jgi:hypothetical protein
MSRLSEIPESTGLTTEWDDPVPANSDWNWDIPVCAPHEVEGQIRSALLARPDMHFTSLVVRRTCDGVCLQGIMQVTEEVPDIAAIVKRVSGVENVLNQLLIQTVDAQVV